MRFRRDLQVYQLLERIIPVMMSVLFLLVGLLVFGLLAQAAVTPSISIEGDLQSSVDDLQAAAEDLQQTVDQLRAVATHDPVLDGNLEAIDQELEIVEEQLEQVEQIIDEAQALNTENAAENGDVDGLAAPLTVVGWGVGLLSIITACVLAVVLNTRRRGFNAQRETPLIQRRGSER